MRFVSRNTIICASMWVMTLIGSHAARIPDCEAPAWQCQEWAVENPSWSGNPFDVFAVATFTHEQTGAQRTTELFYAGDDVWNFRFTGTRAGVWRFTTASEDPELDGHSGRVIVGPRANDDVKGFLTNVSNKYAVMVEDEDDLEGYVYQVYMNQQDFEQQHEHRTRILGDTDRANLIPAYWEDSQENGFEIYFFAVFYSWFKMGALSIDDFDGGDDPALDEPDLATFAMLEQAIRYAHDRGGRTHIWAWGDNGRKQTPNHLGDGFRGERHRRLLRYIAARLGPLPGWSMNFGFDTIEMPKAEADGAWWATQLSDRMGWPHLLTSRGWDDAAFGAYSYAGFGGAPYDLMTTDKGPAGYDEILHHMQARTDRPHIYEERHTYNRWQCWPHAVADPNRLNETGCRRLIWWETMAGGMGGFFGHFSERFNAYGPFNPDGPCGYHPESLKRAFRTHREFWKDGRMKLDMAPENERVSGATAYCLASADKTHFIVFVEDADVVTIDLSGMPGTQPVVAVDAKAEYSEIALKRLGGGTHTLELGWPSDWVLAVGDFED